MRYLVLSIAALASAAALAGAPSDGEHSGRSASQSGRQLSIDKLTQMLQLDQQQAGQVEQILNSERDRLQALRDDANGGNGDARTELQGIREDTMNQLRGVLNEQQVQKLEQLMQQRRGQKHRGQNGSQQRAPTPSTS